MFQRASECQQKVHERRTRGLKRAAFGGIPLNKLAWIGKQREHAMEERGEEGEKEKKGRGEGRKKREKEKGEREKREGGKKKSGG